MKFLRHKGTRIRFGRVASYIVTPIDQVRVIVPVDKTGRVRQTRFSITER